jgi:hypothetical protein
MLTEERLIAREGPATGSCSWSQESPGPWCPRGCSALAHRGVAGWRPGQRRHRRVVGGGAAGTAIRVLATRCCTALGGSCWVGCGWAATASSLPSWPIGRPTPSVSSWPWCLAGWWREDDDHTTRRGAGQDPSAADRARPKAEGAAGAPPPTTAAGRRRFRSTLPGAWVALVLACLAFTPRCCPAPRCSRAWCAASPPPSATGSGWPGPGSGRPSPTATRGHRGPGPRRGFAGSAAAALVVAVVLG